MPTIFVTREIASLTADDLTAQVVIDVLSGKLVGFTHLLVGNQRRSKLEIEHQVKDLSDPGVLKYLEEHPVPLRVGDTITWSTALLFATRTIQIEE